MAESRFYKRQRKKLISQNFKWNQITQTQPNVKYTVFLSSRVILLSFSLQTFPLAVILPEIPATSLDKNENSESFFIASTPFPFNLEFGSTWRCGGSGACVQFSCHRRKPTNLASFFLSFFPFFHFFHQYNRI